MALLFVPRHAVTEEQTLDASLSQVAHFNDPLAISEAALAGRRAR